MIKIISDINEYFEWIEDYICDMSYSSPFCDKARIRSVSAKPDHILLGSYDEDRLTGIFCLLVLDDDKTIETIFMYSRDGKAYAELMGYLQEQYCGYEVWYVFNPNNHILKNRLIDRDAFFYTEQRYMEYKNAQLLDAKDIIPYCEAFKDEYIKIHSDEGYWNGEKVLERIDHFDIYICVREDHLVGYIDLSKGKNVEIMDIWIVPEYRNQGIGALLLSKAIAMVKGKRLILTVDIDNAAANHLYEKMGFKEIPMNNCLTAKYVL